MTRLIIEKELREIIGSTKFAVSFGVCALLILLSFSIGAKNYHVSVAQYEAAKRENIRQMEGLTDWFSVRTHRIFLPPQPLASLVNGVSNDIGRTIEMQGRGELTADDSRYNDEPMFAIFRFLDLEFIFQIVLSLFAIVFAFDSINGEKERGTLRLSFANAVPREKYILGKLLGSFLALGIPLIVAILAGCLTLPLFGISLNGDEWLRLTLVIGAGLLYFGLFLSLSIFVSALTHRSSHSFLMLLVVWILSVLIIPRASVLLAGRAVDVPSVDELASQKNRFSSQLWKEDREKMSAFKATAAEPMKQMEEFQQFMGKQNDERDKKMQEFSGKLNEDRANRQTVQQKLALNLARVSPATTFSLLATTLSGTSLQLKDKFRNEATAYQQSYANFIKAKTGMVPGGRMMVFRMEVNGEKAKQIDPYEMPVFQYNPFSLQDVLSSSLLDFGILVIFNLLFFIGAYIAFIKYDVR
ncbi:MAG: ABC transporter permease subunit [Ignavibacteriales bacterium]|nr:ABC transporter permease subunit [Ignavibacteriales bacterium]